MGIFDTTQASKALFLGTFLENTEVFRPFLVITHLKNKMRQIIILQ
jgi:hypothetical protein